MAPVTHYTGESLSQTDPGNSQQNYGVTPTTPSGTVPEPPPVAENSAIGTPKRAQESELFMENIRHKIEVQREKNKLLEQAALEYRQQFGDDLLRYPEHMASYV